MAEDREIGHCIERTNLRGGVSGPGSAPLLFPCWRNGGSIAFALQSIITVLSGSAYYDQLPVFDAKDNITASTFELTLTPQGRRRGFVIVITFIVVHILLTAFITFMFLTSTVVSSLGNSWQVAAQMRGRAVDKYLSDATLSRDEEIEDRIKRDGKENQFVYIALADDGQRTEIFHNNDNGGGGRNSGAGAADSLDTRADGVRVGHTVYRTVKRCGSGEGRLRYRGRRVRIEELDTL